MMSKYLLFTIAVLTSLFSFSQGNEQSLSTQANGLFEDAKYVEALPLYSQLLSIKTKDPIYNYRFGACALYSGMDKSKALKHLKYAISLGSPAEAYYFLGQAQHRNYAFPQAIQAYQEYSNNSDPKKRKFQDVERQIQNCQFGNQLIASIKDIVVLDKDEAGKQDFFRFFDLNGIGGRILVTPDELLSKEDKKRGYKGIMHYPEGSDILYFSSYGNKGETGLDIYKVKITGPAQFGDPEKLGNSINTPFDEDYAFLHPDGKTFYFSSKGHNCMGGYDVFRSLLDGGSFSQPVNLDFAINTPDDDIFYVTDSIGETAFFASARNSAQGRLHVYKVRVQGIPINFVVLKGDYSSYLNSENPEGILIVKDADTGKPISQTEITGDYVVNLPKAGNYSFELKDKFSNQTHKEIVSIPYFSEPVALAQNMELRKEAGQEKVYFTNDFSSPLDVDLAELSREMLRRKATLDVNADEMLPILENQDVLSVNQTLGNAPQLAGYAEGISIDDVAQQLRSEKASLETLAAELAKNKEVALGQAAKMQQDAEEILARAKTKQLNLPSKESEGYATEMMEIASMIRDAAHKNTLADAALATADGMHVYEQEIVSDLAQMDVQLDTFDSAAETGDVGMIVEKLREVKTQADKQEARVAPSESALASGNNKENEINRKEDYIAQLRTEERSLINKITGLETRLEQTTKKKDREGLEQEVLILKSERVSLEEDLARQLRNAENLSLEAEQDLAEAALYEELMNGGSIENVAPKTYEEAFVAEAQNTSSKQKTEITILRSDERFDQTMADRLDGVTRYDVERMESRSAAIRSFGPAPSYELQQRYIAGDASTQQIAEHLAFWQEEVEQSSYTARDKTLIRKEIRSLQSLADDLPATDLASTGNDLDQNDTNTENTQDQTTTFDPGFSLTQEAYTISLNDLYPDADPLDKLTHENEVSNTYRSAIDKQYGEQADYQSIPQQERLLLSQIDQQQFDTVALRAAYNDLVQTPLDAFPLENREATEAYVQLIRAKEEALQASTVFVGDDGRKSKVAEELTAMKVGANERLIALQATIDEQLADGTLDTEDFQGSTETNSPSTSQPSEVEGSFIAVEESWSSEEVLAELYPNFEEEMTTLDERSSAQEVAEGKSMLTMAALDRIDEQMNLRTQILSDNSSTAVEKQQASEEISALMNARSEQEQALRSYNETAQAERALASNVSTTNTTDETTGNSADSIENTTQGNTGIDGGNNQEQGIPSNEESTANANGNSGTAADDSVANTDNENQTTNNGLEATGEPSTEEDNEGIANNTLEEGTSESENGSGNTTAIGEPGTAENGQTNADTFNQDNADNIGRDGSPLRNDGVEVAQVENVRDFVAFDPSSKQVAALVDKAPNAEVWSEALEPVSEEELVEAAQEMEDLRVAEQNANPVYREGLQRMEGLKNQLDDLTLKLENTEKEKEFNKVLKKKRKIEEFYAKETLELSETQGYLMQREIARKRSAIEAQAMEKQAFMDMNPDIALKLEEQTNERKRLSEEARKFRLKAKETKDPSLQINYLQLAENREQQALQSFAKSELWLENAEELSAFQPGEIDQLLAYNQAREAYLGTGEDNALMAGESYANNVPKNATTNVPAEMIVPSNEWIDAKQELNAFRRYSSIDFELQQLENPALQGAEYDLWLEEMEETNNLFDELESNNQILSAQWLQQAEELEATKRKLANTEDAFIADQLTSKRNAQEQDLAATEELMQANNEAFAMVADHLASQGAAVQTDLVVEDNRSVEIETMPNEINNGTQNNSENLAGGPETNTSGNVSTVDENDTAEAIEAPSTNSTENDPNVALINEEVSTSTGFENTNTALPSIPIFDRIENPEVAAKLAKMMEIPEVLENQLFAKTDIPAYNASNPIPVDVAMPEGLVFKVQVGAFRNPIPQDLFGNFVPIMGERLNSGITRYTVGLFKQFGEANFAKTEVRGIGYADAFVVAFLNGKRIPIADALIQTQESMEDITNNTVQEINTGLTIEESQRDVSTNNNQNSVNSTNGSVDDVATVDLPVSVAQAANVESSQGLFFTVQVGFYSRKVAAGALQNVTPLNSELTSTGKVRYTTGRFGSIGEASSRKSQIQNGGISDAFVTAYYNGKRIALSEARTLLESGAEVNTERTGSVAPNTNSSNNSTGNEVATEDLTFDIVIGTFDGEVPAKVAQALLFLESKYEIRQENNAGKTSYVTKSLDSPQQVAQAKADFASYGVSIQEVRTK